MPQATSPAAKLSDLEQYLDYCIDLAHERLGDYRTMAEIAADESRVNLYPRLTRLEEPRQVLILEDDQQANGRLTRAREAVLQGEILFEHAAAGEGTRLMLGPKYFLNIAEDITIERIAHLLSLESGQIVRPEEVAARLVCPPRDLLDLPLGTRHMLQLAFDLERLALEVGEPPREVRRRQHLLVVIAREMLAHIEKEFYLWHFYGFDPAKVYFMVQESFHGLNLRAGRFFYDTLSPRRLHNHGQMVLQQTLERQLFTLGGPHPWDKVFHEQQTVCAWLQAFKDKISYNIEDLDYLVGSLDLLGLGLALELGVQGYHMIMEVMANNPDKPQKGGMLAWDPDLARDVMIESFQLGNIANRDIKFLNRNFNHYPQPWVAWSQIQQQGLPMPVAVKDGFLYYQPVQGDINFLVRTAFFRRRQMQPIRNLKNPAALPLAINQMHAQDRQPGFVEFVQRCRQGAV